MIKPSWKSSEASLFFVSYTIFFSNVIYSENVTDIDKFDNFKQTKNLKKLPSLVSFPFCVFMKRERNFHSFPNSKMFTSFSPPENKPRSAVHLWTVHFEDLPFTTWYRFCSRWFMLWNVPNNVNTMKHIYGSERSSK